METLGKHLANWTPCGKKRQQQKQISIFFTYRYTNRKAAATSLYSCRKPGTITLVTTRWFRPRMHSTGQATWLPPSFPRSRVSVSFSFSLASCCVQTSNVVMLNNITLPHIHCSFTLLVLLMKPAIEFDTT
jgi:hypothetical protein